MRMNHEEMDQQPLAARCDPAIHGNHVDRQPLVAQSNPALHVALVLCALPRPSSSTLTPSCSGGYTCCSGADTCSASTVALGLVFSPLRSTFFPVLDLPR